MNSVNDNVAQLFFDSAELRAKEIAIISGGNKYSYEEIIQAVKAFVLTHQELKEGAKVLILHKASPELYVALLGLISLGCSAVFVEEWTGMKDVEKCSEILDCEYILCGAKGNFLRLFSKPLRKLKRINIGKWEKYKTENSILPRDASTEAVALYSFSSGSSGTPKIVKRTHANLQAQFAALTPYIPGCDQAIMCTNFPVVVLLNLALGITTFLSENIKLSDISKSNVSALADELQTNKVSHFAFSPYLFHELSWIVKAKSLAPFSCILGGSPVFPHLIDKLMRLWPNSIITSVYGSSEADPIAIAEYNKATYQGVGLPAGHLSKDIEIKIYRPNEGGFGEICVRGNHVVQGYIDSIDRNIIVIVGENWRRTGDFGKLENGVLFLSGRLDLEYQGVPLFECEKLVSAIEGVRRATILNSTVYVETESTADRTAIEKKCREKLKGVEKVKFVKLPTDTRHKGKILYDQLSYTKPV